MSESDTGSSSVFEAFLANTITKCNNFKESLYKKEWEEQFEWLEHHPKFKNSANCVWCKTRISITSSGIEGIKRHAEGRRHLYGLQRQKNGLQLEQSSDSDSENTNQHFKYTYESKWKKTFTWLASSSKASLGKCTICHVDFSIGYRGVNDVKRHMCQARHIRAVKSANKQDSCSPKITYDSEWENKYEWIKPGTNSHMVFCKLCKIEFSIEFGGKYHIAKHSKTAQHKQIKSPQESCSDSSLVYCKKRKKEMIDRQSLKRLQKYNSEWENQFNWLRKCESSNMNAWCTVCLKSFSIAYRGLGDVNRHKDQIKHNKNVEQFNDNPEAHIIQKDSDIESKASSFPEENISGNKDEYILKMKTKHTIEEIPSTKPIIFKIDISGNVIREVTSKNEIFTDILTSPVESNNISDHSTELTATETNGLGTSKQKENDDNSGVLYWDSFMTNSVQKPDSDSANEIAEEPFPISNIRYNKYNTVWEKTFNWITACTKTEYQAECKICNSKFSIKYRGFGDVKRHHTQRRHAFNASKLSHSLVNGEHDVHIRNTEIAHVFHTICHEENDIISDCAQRLYTHWFPESPTALEFTCPGNKVKGIITDILLPLAQQQITTELSNNHYFSMLVDTSQANNFGACSIILRYYVTLQNGVQTKLLTFFTPTTTPSKDANDIYLAINQQLEIFGLCIANCTAFVANNSILNHGVFSKLQLLNSNLLFIKNSCRGINNSARRAQNVFKFDIEQIIYKCFNELIMYADIDQLPLNLTELINWLKIEWHIIWENISTKWLSIATAAKRFFINFKYLQNYYMSAELPAPECLRTFFESETAECYLNLFVGVCETLQQSCIFIETSDKLSVLDLHKTMEHLHNSLYAICTDIKETIYKFENAQLLEQFRNDAHEYYRVIIGYIINEYDVENKTFEFLEPMRLTRKTTLTDFQNIVTQLGLTEIDTNDLYKEIRMVNKYYVANIPNEILRGSALIEFWTSYLLVNNSPNIQKICSYVFSLPLSNMASERLNHRLNVCIKRSPPHHNEVITAKLIIKEHFSSVNCIDFGAFLDKSDIQKKYL